MLKMGIRSTNSHGQGNSIVSRTRRRHVDHEAACNGHPRQANFPLHQQNRICILNQTRDSRNVGKDPAKSLIQKEHFNPPTQYSRWTYQTFNMAFTLPTNAR